MSSSKTLEQLIAQMQQQKYTPLTQEQMQTQATNRYKSAYDQKRQSANQAYQTSDLALAQQLAGLQASYDKQREDTEKGFKQTHAQADRQALGRGMQRSSYNSATLANIDLKGQEAQQDINKAQAAQERNINQQRTLAAQQLAAQLASYDAQQKSDELAYMDELEAREYDRSFNNQQAQNQLTMDIYGARFNQEQADREQSNWQASMDYQKLIDELEQSNWEKQFAFNQEQFDYQKEQDALAQSNWLKQFNAQYGGKSSGGGSYSGGTRPAPTSNTDSKGLFDRLNGSATQNLNAGGGGDISAIQKPSDKKTPTILKPSDKKKGTTK